MGVSITLETYDYEQKQHIIKDAFGIIYSNHYSQEGSGFGFLRFTVKRKPNRVHHDLKQMYEVRLRKGIKNILYHGLIVKIQEDSNGDVEVDCVGFNTVLSFDILNRVIVDNRTNRWIPGCEPSGSFRPDKFDIANDWTIITDEGLPTEVITDYEGIQFTPKDGMDYVSDDYVFSRYRFNFGETAKRIRFSWNLSIPNSFPAKIILVDSDDPFNIVWEKSVSSNGSVDINITTFDGPFLEFRFIITDDGLATAEEGTVYARIWDLIIYSDTDSLVDAATIAKYIATYMQTNYSFSSDQSLIQDTDFELLQAAYDGDERLNEVMTNACQFGDNTGEAIVWGTWFDDKKRVFVDVLNKSSVSYVLPETIEYNIGGDFLDTYQKVYGKYRTKAGIDLRTSAKEDTFLITTLNNYYRTEVIDYGENDDTQVDQALDLALSQNKEIKIKTNFDIFSVSGPNGNIIPAEEIRSGNLCQLSTFSANNVYLQKPNSDSVYTFIVAKVEIDLDENMATLTPKDDVQTFNNYLTELQRMLN